MENETKLRILYLYHYLVQNTDVDHPMSTAELMKMLMDKFNIKVSRNTISNDLQILHGSGLHIEVIHSTQNKYYHDDQPFEVAEMKLLLDAIVSSKFLTEYESEELINKLLKKVPICSARELRRHIFVTDRVKSDNKCGYYIVDTVNKAIEQERKISFRYTDYDLNRTRFVSNNGEAYTVSPYTLMWDGDFYYLRGFCDERREMRTFRLDRIEKQPEMLEESAVPKPENYNLSQYSKSVFRMYETDAVHEVTLLGDASVMKALIDQFGIEVDTEPVDENHFQATVTVCTSPTFYRWVFGFCGKIRILGPESVIEQYHEMARIALS